MFEVNQIVKGKVAGWFVVLGSRDINGQQRYQLKGVNPDNVNDTSPGELWLPEEALEAVRVSDY